MTQTVKTSCGFEAEIDTDKLNDWEVLDALSGLDDGDMLCGPRLLRKILTKDDVKRLYDICRDDAGRIPPEAIEAAIIDIFKGVADGKKF